MMHAVVFVIGFCLTFGFLFCGRKRGGAISDKGALFFLVLGGIILSVSMSLTFAANAFLPRSLALLMNAPTYGLTGSMAGGAALVTFGLVSIVINRLRR